MLLEICSHARAMIPCARFGSPHCKHVRCMVHDSRRLSKKSVLRIVICLKLPRHTFPSEVESFPESSVAPRERFELVIFDELQCGEAIHCSVFVFMLLAMKEFTKVRCRLWKAFFGAPLSMIIWCHWLWRLCCLNGSTQESCSMALNLWQDWGFLLFAANLLLHLWSSLSLMTHASRMFVASKLLFCQAWRFCYNWA